MKVLHLVHLLELLAGGLAQEDLESTGEGMLDVVVQQLIDGVDDGTGIHHVERLHSLDLL